MQQKQLRAKIRGIVSSSVTPTTKEILLLWQEIISSIYGDSVW